MKIPYTYADILSVCSWLFDNEGDWFEFPTSDDFVRALRVIDLEIPLNCVHVNYETNSIMIKTT